MPEWSLSLLLMITNLVIYSTSKAYQILQLTVGIAKDIRVGVQHVLVWCGNRAIVELTIPSFMFLIYYLCQRQKHLREGGTKAHRREKEGRKEQKLKGEGGIEALDEHFQRLRFTA